MSVVARTTLALVWLWQGLVPKLLGPEHGERAFLEKKGLVGDADVVLPILGAAEMLWGLAFLVFLRWRWLHAVNAALLAVLGVGAAVVDPAMLLAPFSAGSLVPAMVGLSVVGWVAERDLPSARCARRPSSDDPR